MASSVFGPATDGSLAEAQSGSTTNAPVVIAGVGVRIIDGVLNGVMNGVRAFMPVLLSQDAGHLVNTSSIR